MNLKNPKIIKKHILLACNIKRFMDTHEMSLFYSQLSVNRFSFYCFQNDEHKIFFYCQKIACDEYSRKEEIIKNIFFFGFNTNNA